MELLFLIGVAWACSRAVEALRKPASARWAKHQAARKGSTPADRAKARAARMAVAGFWAGEITRGLPHARHGWAQGWAEHRESVTQRERERARSALQRERDAAQQDADDAGWWNRTRAEMAAHRHRLQIARERSTRPPTMSEQLTADVIRQRQNGDHSMRSENCTNPGCSCHAADPPLADGKTPGSGSPGQNGNPAQPTTGGNMTTPGGDTGSGGDFNYDSTVELCDELIAAAEEAANSPAMDKAQALADALGAMLNNDSGALGKAAEVAQDAQAGKAAARQLVEDAAALKDHIVSNYGPIVEATDASAGSAPQPEFVDH